MGDPAQVPWLIKQAAISHVASASAWMSLNTLAKAKPASEAFAAWGDLNWSPKNGRHEVCYFDFLEDI